MVNEKVFDGAFPFNRTHLPLSSDVLERHTHLRIIFRQQSTHKSVSHKHLKYRTVPFSMFARELYAILSGTKLI